MRLFVTGGAGYIGSHTVVEALAAGHEVTVLDDLSNAKPSVFGRIQQICGRMPHFIEGDVRDRRLLRLALPGHDAVIHFAGLKAVGESVARPLEYYDVNVSGTVSLLEAMADADVRTLAFSSSATVYGVPESVPIREDFPRSATNPYGRSKLIVEEILSDLVVADPTWRIAVLRYFNPVGAHPSGLIGEDPNGIPNNLAPYIAKVAAGRLPLLSVFGDDWPTRDGTGVRDYIHVMDLAQGHLAALAALESSHSSLLVVNLGTGRSVSVLELVRAFELASGRPVPCRIVGRRQGDVAECWADPSLAKRLLGWEATRGLDEMCVDTWRWETSQSFPA